MPADGAGADRQHLQAWRRVKRKAIDLRACEDLRVAEVEGEAVGAAAAVVEGAAGGMLAMV